MTDNPQLGIIAGLFTGFSLSRLLYSQSVTLFDSQLGVSRLYKALNELTLCFSLIWACVYVYYF